MPSPRLVSLVTMLALNGASDFVGPQDTPLASPALEAGCSIAQVQALAPADTTITGATLVAGAQDLPRYCRIDGHVADAGQHRAASGSACQRTGTASSTSRASADSAAPSDPSNAGLVAATRPRPPTPVTTPTIRRWGSNHAKEIDYGHRGTHVTAVAAKALTASFYGRAPGSTPTSTAARTAGARR